MAVVNLAAAIITAYHEGSDLLYSIKERRWARGTAHLFASEEKLMQDLEFSLARGSDAVQDEYEQAFQRLGARFASGDEPAVETLNEVVICMQKRLISVLKIAWQQDTHVDYYRLQDLSFDAADRTTECLSQLHQRLLVTPPFDRAREPSRSSNPYRFSPPRGLPQAYIDPASPHTSYSQPFGNHVVIAAGPRESSKSSAQSRPGSKDPQPPPMDVEPRIQHVSSMTSDFIPIEYRREEQYHHHHHHHHHEKAMEETNKKYYQPEQRFPDSPTLSPARISSIGSTSDYGDQDYDDPAFNPWSAGGTDSPISSYNGSLSPVPKSPYAPSLMPDALAPRRQQDERDFHSRDVYLHESLRNMSLGPQHRNESFESPTNVALRSPFHGSDDVSVYSRDESCMSFYQHPSPGERHRLESYFPAPPPGNSQRLPTYTWMPPRSPAREIMRSPPPQQQHRLYPPQHSPFREAPRPPPTAPLPRVPPREHAISPVPVHKWEAPRAAPPPAIPEDRSVHRAPVRLTALTTTSLSSASSAAFTTTSSQPPPSAHSSYHLANRRVSTVSSSNSSQHSAPKVIPTQATRVIPSSAPPGNVKACLPSESNKFAGFCKGAWRGQIGDKKKAYEDRSRPAGISSTKVLNYYKCKKCNFEGRAIKEPGAKKATPDSKVYGSNGILYRWEFLFKSHVDQKTPHMNPVEASYGCMFCCAAGKGTPIYSGLASLLAHLQEHREVLPEGEIVYRMNAVVGRSPDPDEDFDVALPSLVL